jgi:hypothetical protein
MRFWLISLCLAGALLQAADEREAARAWQQQSWLEWSMKTGLSVGFIEDLWHAAMGLDFDDSFGQGIETVDAATLKNRKQILFVVSQGNGHCLTVFVYERSRRKKAPIWELDQRPEGGGICHEQFLGYPTAFAQPTGDVVVQIPTGPAWIKPRLGGQDDAYPISTTLTIYTYRWDGKTYRLAREQEVVTYRSETITPDKCFSAEPCVQ